MNEQNKPVISVIIPVYNEARIVAETVHILTDYLNTEFSYNGYEIVFADDGSTDKTAEIIRGISHPNVRIVGHMPNKGKGAAVRNGMLDARGEFALFTDCDLAYGTDVIGRFYDALKESGADAAIGSRRLLDGGYAGYTMMRRLASKVYYKAVALLAGFKYSDSQCGIKCFKTELAKQVFSQSRIDGFAFDLEVLLLIAKSDSRVLELPVTVINHRASKVHVFRDSFRMLRDVMKIKRLHKT